MGYYFWFYYGKTDLVIGEVIHKAFCEVNEEGTEAAAATAVIMAPTCMPGAPSRPHIFRVDHPFLFLIYQRKIKSILFMGPRSNAYFDRFQMGLESVIARRFADVAIFTLPYWRLLRRCTPRNDSWERVFGTERVCVCPVYGASRRSLLIVFLPAYLFQKDTDIDET